jgi:hypothetical protein
LACHLPQPQKNGSACAQQILRQATINRSLEAGQAADELILGAGSLADLVSRKFGRRRSDRERQLDQAFGGRHVSALIRCGKSGRRPVA